ncbi:MAG TPA: hypothetical protein VKM55_23775 [Candidatus Lokiarchaeia archaeon]|nr:hypothetical protein [Candidatus Lokiarchaeia archaeon]
MAPSLIIFVASAMQMLKIFAGVRFHNQQIVILLRRRAPAKSIALSTFDSIKGPKMQFFITDGFVNEAQKEEISSMISVKVSTDYFLVRMNNLTCYNKQFNIRSANARGKVEMLMISLVTNKFPIQNAEKFFLKEADSFIAFLRGQDDASLLFHLEKDYDEEEQEGLGVVFEETLLRLKTMLERFS